MNTRKSVQKQHSKLTYDDTSIHTVYILYYIVHNHIKPRNGERRENAN